MQRLWRVPSSGKLPGELLDRKKGFELRNGESETLLPTGNVTLPEQIL